MPTIPWRIFATNYRDTSGQEISIIFHRMVGGEFDFGFDMGVDAVESVAVLTAREGEIFTVCINPDPFYPERLCVSVFGAFIVSLGLDSVGSRENR